MAVDGGRTRHPASLQAVQNEDVQIVRNMLANGVDPNTADERKAWTRTFRFPCYAESNPTDPLVKKNARYKIEDALAGRGAA